MDDVPKKGDLRFPTLGGTIFVGVLLFLAAATLSLWLDWGVWPYIPAALIFLYLVVSNLLMVRVSKHSEHARAVVEDLIARREHFRAAAEQLRVHDPARYQEILSFADGTDAENLARENPDVYVAMFLGEADGMGAEVDTRARP